MPGSNDQGIFEAAKQQMSDAAQATKDAIKSGYDSLVGKSGEQKAADKVKSGADKAAEAVEDFREKAGDKVHELGNKMQQ
ncbi:unnamed protein product [Enterobius vermicularis]|uniref:CsbD family protein n=1 Tax=Enterobius vermicularis TaxID=51028 RepID=A0A0N4V1W5_ENTVE|nr:unnamed protein product [Enterobius vermicularis]